MDFKFPSTQLDALSRSTVTFIGRTRIPLINMKSRRLLLLALLVIVVPAAGPSMGKPSTLRMGSAHPSSTDLLCNEGKIICVSRSVAHSLVSNPFGLEVLVNSPDDIELDWEIEDSTGQVLESSSTYDDIDLPTRHSSPKNTLHIHGFLFEPAKSQTGTLTLSPSRFSISTGKVDLPAFKIPVQLTTAKTLVTWLEPEDPEALQRAVVEWVESEDHPEFRPKLKLLPRQVAIMRVESDAITGAIAEAVLRHIGGQDPWHVTYWHQDGSTAHVTIQGSGWAGVTYYLTEVSYLIKESVLNLPGIKTFIFDQAK
jgi:hypothetical protein